MIRIRYNENEWTAESYDELVRMLKLFPWSQSSDIEQYMKMTKDRLKDLFDVDINYTDSKSFIESLVSEGFITSVEEEA